MTICLVEVFVYWETCLMGWVFPREALPGGCYSLAVCVMWIVVYVESVIQLDSDVLLHTVVAYCIL